MLHIPRAPYFSLAEQFSPIPHQNHQQSYRAEVEAPGQSSSALRCHVPQALPA